MKVVRTSVRMMIRVAGYALSAIVASVFYIVWVVAELSFSNPGTLQDRLLAASIFFFFGGFLAALVLMTAPWMLIVWTYRRTRFSGAAYFACAGAVLTILVACTASSLSWKPLFIEDQTFLEGVFIALERQGVCLALAGVIFGLGYWFLGEKNCRLEAKS